MLLYSSPSVMVRLFLSPKTNSKSASFSCPLTSNRNHSVAFSGENHLYVDTRKKSLPGLEMLILLAKLFSISEASFDGSLVNPLIGSGQMEE